MTNKPKWSWARHQHKWYGKWHLYIGIIAGAIVAFVGITGSILAFRDEIDRILNPELFYVQQQAHRMNIAEALSTAKAKNPNIHIDYIYYIDDQPNGTYTVLDEKTEHEVFINPYNGDIAGKRAEHSSFISVVLALHTSLLIPQVGRYIVGLASLCLLILIISGLRLWLPKKWSQLKKGFTINLKGSFKRQNYDWHNVLGIYSSPVIVLIAITGFCITFSQPVIAFIFILNGQNPAGLSKIFDSKSAYTVSAQPLTPEKIYDIATRVMPEGKIRGMALPVDSSGTYRTDIECPSASKAGNREMLTIDQYSGKILIDSRKDFPNMGRAYLSWLTPLHFGTFGGLTTRIIALIASFIPAALFITGFIIWYPRWKRRRVVSDKIQHSDQ